MGFWNDLYNNTVGKVVDTAKNLWTAGTAPTESRTLWGAAGEAAQHFEKLQSPTTKAAEQKKIAQLKSPEATKARQQKLETENKEITSKIGAVFNELTSVHPDVWGMFGKKAPTTGGEAVQAIIGKAPDLPGGSTIATPEARAKRTVERAAAEAAEFKSDPEILKRITQLGAGIRSGLTGQEMPEYFKTENKVADTITGLVGMGIGFWAGGEITGAAGLAAKGAGAVERFAAPVIARLGEGAIPKIANSIVKGAVHAGLESEMLSGIHSVLNADTAEEAKKRAIDYGLMGVIGGGAAGGLSQTGIELLGAIGKRLKSVTPEGKITERLKGETAELKAPRIKNVSEDTIAQAKKMFDNFDIETPKSVVKTANVLKNVIDHHETYPAGMVKEAKLTLADLFDRYESRYSKLEMAQDLTPSTAELEAIRTGGQPLDQAVPKAKKNITPEQAGTKTVQLIGKGGEKIRAKVETVPGSPDEFFYQQTGQFGKPVGERTWGKTDYWTINEVQAKAPKMKTPKAAEAAPTAAPITEAAAPTEAAPSGTVPAAMPAEAATTAAVPEAGGAGVPPTGELPTMPDIIPSSPKKLKGKKGISTKWDNFYMKTVDDMYPISKVSKQFQGKAGKMAANVRSSVGGITENIVKRELVDKSGNVIGDSLEKVMNKVPEGKENSFWQYVANKINEKTGKAVPEYTPEMSARAISQIDAANPEFAAIYDDMNKWVEKFGAAWGKDPEKIMADIFKREPETGMYPNPVSKLMDKINSTVKHEKYNDVMRELVHNIQTAPERVKGTIEILKEKPYAMEGVKTVKMEDGSEVYLLVKDKMLSTAFDNILRVSDDLKAVRAINNAFKSILTTKNPIFGLKNMMRDIPTSYVFGSAKNPLKFVADLGQAFGESFKATYFPKLKGAESLKLYRRLGGGGGGYFKTGEMAMDADTMMRFHNPITKIEQGKKAITFPTRWLGKQFQNFNDMIEVAPRLAEFNRVLKKTGNVEEALYAANDVTVNFSRGGTYVKKADIFVPYLNAGVQGLDKLAREVKTTKGLLNVLWKSGVSITVPSIAFWAMNAGNPNYQKLSTQVKDNNFIIPNLWGAKDAAGQPQTFIKIPKSRELGVLFGALGERILDKLVLKKEGAFKGYVMDVIDNTAPANPIFANLGMPLVQAWANRNFFGGKIVPTSMELAKTPAYLQKDDKTSKLSVFIAQQAHNLGIDKALAAVGLDNTFSPKLMDYVINQYTGLIGDMVLGSLTPSKGLKGGTIGTLVNQFMADELQSNQDLSNFYDMYDEVSGKVAEAKALGLSEAETNQRKIINNAVAAASKAITAVNKKIAASKDENEKRKLKQEAIDIADTYNKWVKAGGTGGIPPIPADTGVKASTGKLKSTGGTGKKKSTGTSKKKSTSGTKKKTTGTTKKTSTGKTTTTTKSKLKTPPTTTYPKVSGGGGGSTTYPSVTGGGGGTTGGGGSVVGSFLK